MNADRTTTAMENTDRPNLDQEVAEAWTAVSQLLAPKTVEKSWPDHVDCVCESLCKNLVGKIIVVDGIIGVGKTTWIRRLSRFFDALGESPQTQFINVLHFPECIDPIPLGVFYQNKKEMAMTFQNMCMQEALHRMRMATDHSIFDANESILLVDCGLIRTRVFAEVLHDDGLMTDNEFNQHTKMHDAILANFKNENIVTCWMHVPPDICLDRIKQRGRPSEVAITLDYLNKLHAKYRRFYELNVIPEPKFIFDNTFERSPLDFIRECNLAIERKGK